MLKKIGIILVVITISIGFTFKILYDKYTVEGYQPREIVGKSMEPTLKNGMFVVTQRYDNKKGVNNIIKRGDIVIYSSLYNPGFDFIHRVIAIPKDTIMINKTGVYLNGKKLNESYLPKDTQTALLEDGFMKPNKMVTVPENNYFVMGDHRQNAADSRGRGFVLKNEIQAKYLFCYWNCK